MKQVFKLVNLFLVVLLLSFTSCTNDLSEKNPEISFSFELPQERINRATNENSDNTLWNINAQIENTKEIIQKIKKTAYSGETVTLTFKEIIVGQKVRINIDLTQDGVTTPSYTGSSDWFIVKKDENKINISLNKVTSNENNEPPTIVDAAEPQINVYPTSKVEITTENNSQEELTETLSVNATSTDGGTLSFIWQEKNSDGNWENITDYTTSTTNGQTSCSIDVTVNKGQSRTFKCIITNTNNSVNGNKTATIETNEVTVAYVEGQLASIKAQYIGEYEKFNYEDFYSNGKVTVTETYTSGTNNQTSITFDASENRYDIQKVNNDEKAIGYVPYTVKYNENTNISTKIRVPVKYELRDEDFSITSSTNPDQSTNSSDNPEKIPQFTGNTVLTVGSKGETSGVPTTIYQNDNDNSPSYYDIMTTGVTSSWEKDSSACDNTTTSISVDNRNQGNSTYNATITPISNSWCVGTSITLNYYIKVCPWTIKLQSENGTTVDLTNLTGGTNYTLSATNDAVTNPIVTYESSNTDFYITGTTLKTPTATTTDQTATITTKVDNVTIGTIKVTAKQDTLGSMANPFTNWTELCNYLNDTSTDATTIYVKGTLDATETVSVNRPVTIIPVEDVSITLGSFDDELFNVKADFTLKGDISNQFYINGNGRVIKRTLITTTSSNITLEYVTMQDWLNFDDLYQDIPAGSAITFNCKDKALSLKNCNFKDLTTCLSPNYEYFNPAIGAICFENGNLILDTCNFTHNEDYYEYVDLYCYPKDTSKITLKGNITLPIIQYANTNSNGDLQITLDDITVNSDNIQIYVDNISYEYDTDLFTLNNEQILPNCFTLLNEGYEFDYTNGKIVEKTSGGNGGGSGTPLSGTTVSTFETLKNAVETGTESVIFIGENITLTECINISREVTIAANSDVTLTQPTNAKNLFSITSTGNLTLGGGTGTLTLNGNNNASEDIIYVNGTLKLNNGCVINGYSCAQNVAVIQMVSGTFEMAGGIIQNHSESAISNYEQSSNCIIKLYGGEIKNNSAKANGGAINLRNKKTLTLDIYGTIKIHSNSCNSSSYGGSIYTTGANNTVNINSSTEHNNYASIYDNKHGTTNQGASIYHNSNSTVKIMNSTLNAYNAYTQNIIDGVEQ